MTDEEQKKIISDNLTRLIESHGIDQRRICDDLGIKPTTLSQWVCAKAVPSLVVLRTLAEYFGVSLYEIIDPESPPDSLMSAIQPFLCEDSIKLLSKYKRAAEWRQKAVQELLKNPNT